MDWLELTVETDSESVEIVSEIFADVGYNAGVVIEQPLVQPEGEYADWSALSQPEIDPTRNIQVRTYMPNDDNADEKRQMVERALYFLRTLRYIGPLQVRECKEEDWANAWKDYYGVLRVGHRTVIKPSWLEYSSREGDIVLDLDPGMAFGTGLHASTRLCLAALEEHVRPGMNILDLGTGSGILAIAAAKLGKPDARVLALDRDMVAVEAATENVQRNGLAGHIEVEEGSTSEARRNAPYDLIVVNILATVIIELSKSLYDLLKPGGTIIASGIFVDRGNATAQALEKAGLTVEERKQEGDWVCLVCVRGQ